MLHNDITGAVIDTAMDIHRRLGPGLLESVYLHVLAFELRKRGLRVDAEVPIPVVWEDVKLDVGFRADLIVEGLVVVELKSIEAVAPVHKKILLTYLRLADKRVGLLINFGCELLKNGICRVVNGLEDAHAEAQRPRREFLDSGERASSDSAGVELLKSGIRRVVNGLEVAHAEAQRPRREFLDSGERASSDSAGVELLKSGIRRVVNGLEEAHAEAQRPRSEVLGTGERTPSGSAPSAPLRENSTHES